VTYFEGATSPSGARRSGTWTASTSISARGGARDAAHRLAQMGRTVAWREDLAVTKALPSPTAADGGRTAREWGGSTERSRTAS